MILKVTDFTGEYYIAQDCYTDLTDYIVKYERYYLLRLFGAELYKLFIADLVDGIPQTSRFIDIYQPFALDDDHCLRDSEGIKAMLKEFVYYHILLEQPNIKTTTGTVKMQNENSSMSTYDFNIIEAYNKGVENYKTIQWFICDRDEDYPEENMQLLDYTSGI